MLIMLINCFGIYYTPYIILKDNINFVLASQEVRIR